MKALLQQLETGLYFKDPTTWTVSLAEAYDFKSSVSARTYCLNRGITNAQIILKFANSEYDIILPAQYPRTHDGSTGTTLGPGAPSQL
jgi:hypothetical protein